MKDLPRLKELNTETLNADFDDNEKKGYENSFDLELTTDQQWNRLNLIQLTLTFPFGSITTFLIVLVMFEQLNTSCEIVPVFICQRTTTGEFIFDCNSMAKDSSNSLSSTSYTGGYCISPFISW